MSSYLDKEDIQLSKNFFKKGYKIKKVSDLKSLKILRATIVDSLCKSLKNKNEKEKILINF